MNWLPSLGAWQFAAAGAAGALATILIHILNRRRHQVLHWAAMEFLQDVVKRKRRVIQLRDAILLTLRALAVLLFGLALARPHYSAGDSITGPQPIHAIIVLDNSLSMSYRTLEGQLLAQAKRDAIDLAKRLPPDSHFSILAACGNRTTNLNEPVVDVELAISQIEQVKIADAAARIDDIIAVAQEAASFETNLSKQLIVFSDQQATTWENVETTGEIELLDSIQLVDMSPAHRENTFITNIAVQDGFAEARATSTVRVTVQRSGGRSIRQAEVALLVDEQLVGTKRITFQPDDTVFTVSFEHSFRLNTTRVVDYVPIKAIISEDRLPIDDVRHAIIPIFPRLPIVYIDQYGASGEDVHKGHRGETRTIRRLLQSDRDEDLREVTQGPRHITIDELSENTLEGVAVVVVAGVNEPGERVAILRKFVEEGGNLLLAAGGKFAPQAWNNAAWLDGNGILPAPLTGKTLGATPDEVEGTLTPSLLAFESTAKERLLRLPEVSDDDLKALYSEPLFFKTVEIDTSTTFSSAYRVAARLEHNNGPPLLLERSIGQGKVLFWTSGLTSNWNTLPKSNAVAMLDRLTRELLRSTVVNWNQSARDAINVELPAIARDASITLSTPPNATSVPLESGYFDHARFGVTIQNAFDRGLYKLTASPRSEGSGRTETDSIWEQMVAVNGDPNESNLQPATDGPIAQLAQQVPISLATSGEDLSVGDSHLFARGAWWWFALVVLVLLVAETVVLITASQRKPFVHDVGLVT